jgi:hypothetical protein
MDEACNEAFQERREELLHLLRKTQDDLKPIILPKPKKNN